MIFPIFNSMLSAFLVFLVVYKLTHIRDAFNKFERIGLGLIGGGAIMRIVVWWNPNSPFNDWSATVWLVGLNFYIGGRLYRNLKHARRNAEQIRIAERHLAARGDYRG